MDKKTVDILISSAISAREKSYSPYSGFAVGAALMTNDGKIYTGANIEVSSHTPTLCAERVAFSSAVHAGEREFSAIAVLGGIGGEPVNAFCPPCGVCRQVMSEFCGGDFEIILFDGNAFKILTLDELLPERFGKDNLC